MTIISNIFIPIVVLIIVIYGLYKKVDIFDRFIDGVKEGLSMSLNIFPTILAMIISINVLLKSNLIFDLTNWLQPVFDFLHFPKELLPISLLRPISGSSSLILLDNIFKTYTPDSFIGRVASVIQGSTDTTIYIIGLYFGSIKIKKTKYSLAVGLLTDFATIIIAIIVVSLLF